MKEQDFYFYFFKWNQKIVCLYKMFARHHRGGSRGSEHTRPLKVTGDSDVAHEVKKTSAGTDRDRQHKAEKCHAKTVEQRQPGHVLLDGDSTNTPCCFVGNSQTQCSLQCSLPIYTSNIQTQPAASLGVCPIVSNKKKGWCCPSSPLRHHFFSLSFRAPSLFIWHSVICSVPWRHHFRLTIYCCFALSLQHNGCRSEMLLVSSSYNRRNCYLNRMQWCQEDVIALVALLLL